MIGIRMIGIHRRVVMVTAVLLACGWVALQAEEDSKTKPQLAESKSPDLQSKDSQAPKALAPPAPRKPAPLTENAKRGLEYLVQQQDASGGWGQGGGWRINGDGNGRVEGKDVKDPPDVGNTCIAALALLRSGSTPKQGPYAANLAKAVQFITERVDAADGKSLYVTDQRDTQLQSKIGKYVDTFLAGLVLSELKGRMPDQPGEVRLLAALNKTIHKIEINQTKDGNFVGNTGWASVLSQGLCSKALSRAKLAGAAVSEQTLDRDINHTVAQLDAKTGKFAGSGVGARGGFGAFSETSSAGPVSGRIVGKAGVASTATPSDAGVKIYGQSANSGRLQDQVNGARPEKAAAKKILANSAAPAKEKAEARLKLGKIDRLESANASAVNGTVESLDDKGFIAGFGNNGGEEFLSYMNISETLVVNGGAEWEKWNQKTTENINRVQNTDGSWSGSHCITGRTFCTAAALLTLMADRMPTPVAAKLANEK